MAYKGRFTPKNPQKYKGDPTKIIWRSSWELISMKKFDENPDVIEWSSEETIVPYISPIDGKVHRYFPDFVIKTRQRDGSIKTHMIEVKPKKETVEPKPQKRRTKKYIAEVMTWAKNQAKWKYAEEYCADRGWEFMKLTEDHIFGKER
jgi:hypothetical protein